MKTKITLLFMLLVSANVFANEPKNLSTKKPLKIPVQEGPEISAGLDFGFRWSGYINSIVKENENKSSSFVIAPQAWIGINSQFTVVPAFGFGFYNSQNNSAAFNNSFSERSYYPSLALLRYCDDPCDDYEFFSGIRLGGQFSKGTGEYEQISTHMKTTTDSKTTGFNVSAVAGVNYNFLDNFTGTISTDVIQFNRSKQINDIKIGDNFNTFSGFSFGREVRLGARFIF